MKANAHAERHLPGKRINALAKTTLWNMLPSLNIHHLYRWLNGNAAWIEPIGLSLISYVPQEA
jgi:hypothetical protein